MQKYIIVITISFVCISITSCGSSNKIDPTQTLILINSPTQIITTTPTPIPTYTQTLTMTPTTTVHSISPTLYQGTPKVDDFIILYPEVSEEKCRVMSVPFSGGETKNVIKTPLDNCYSISISPDGKMIAFDDGLDKSVYIANIDGSEPNKVFSYSGECCFNIRWSPNGKNLAIVNDSSHPVCDGSMGCESLYIISLGASNDPKEVYLYIDDVLAKLLSWSPDSQWVFIPSIESIGPVLLRIEDSYSFRIPSQIYGAPFLWSSDSHSLSHIENQICSSSYMVPFEDSGIAIFGTDESIQFIHIPCEYFSSDANFDDLGALWTPDGLSYVIYHKLSKSLVEIDKGGKITRTITAIDSHATNFRWSPDGKWVVYNEKGTIKAVKRDGSEIRAIVTGISTEFTIAW